MSDSTDPKKRKLEAALASARTTVALLECELADVAVGDDPILDLKTLAAEFRQSEWTLRRWALDGRIAATRGARGKLLVHRSAVRAALEATPVVPRRKASNETAPADEDLLDELLERGGAVERGRR
jgi:hypothetical protein